MQGHCGESWGTVEGEPQGVSGDLGGSPFEGECGEQGLGAEGLSK